METNPLETLMKLTYKMRGYESHPTMDEDGVASNFYYLVNMFERKKRILGGKHPLRDGFSSFGIVRYGDFDFYDKIGRSMIKWKGKIVVDIRFSSRIEFIETENTDWLFKLTRLYREKRLLQIEHEKKEKNKFNQIMKKFGGN